MVGGCVVDDGRPPAPGAIPPIDPRACAGEQLGRSRTRGSRTGLAGSGSHHYSTKDLFVPSTVTRSISRRRPAATSRSTGHRSRRRCRSRWPACPSVWRGARSTSSVALAGKKTIAHSAAARAAQESAACAARGGAGGKLCSARRAPMSTRRWSGSGREVEDARRRVAGDAARRGPRAHSRASHGCRGGAARLYDTAGRAAVYASAPLDRLLRDAVTINQHQLFNDGVLEELGAMALGDEVATRFV